MNPDDDRQFRFGRGDLARLYVQKQTILARCLLAKIMIEIVTAQDLDAFRPHAIRLVHALPCLDRLRSYFGLRGNGMKPSRLGILTLGSECASITSFGPMIPLRLRI